MPSQQLIWDDRFSVEKKYDYEIDWIIPYFVYFKERGYENILELGCGDGKCAVAMQSAGFNVLATDISDVAIKKLATRYEGVAAECVDMSKGLPYANESFDVVVSILSSHYFSSEKTAKVYADVLRVLKAGGAFLLRVNDEREYEINKKSDTVEVLGMNYVLSINGKKKHYFDTEDLRGCLACFPNTQLNKVSLWCNGHKKFALEALAHKG